MLYLVTPHLTVKWFDIHAQTALDAAAEHNADLAQLEWLPAEAHTYSHDLLRIALRHGAPCSAGIVLDARHTVDLGRADEIRVGQQAIDEYQAQIQATHGQMFEAAMPGWTESGDEINERVRESTERIAQEAETDLAEVLSAPLNQDLVDHWTRIGGALPPN